MSVLTKIANPFKKFFNGVKNFFVNLVQMFTKGDAKTRTSFLFMGLGNILRLQYIKGFIFMAFEALFILFMVFFGGGYLSKLGSLGDVATREWYDDEGIIHYEVVDNSFLILLYAVLTIFVVLFFVIIYYKNLQSAYKAQLLQESGKPLPSFKKDVFSLLDEKYHITLLSLPSLGVIAFTIIPLIVMICLAFTNYDAEHLPPGNLFDWVGISNITGMFSGKMGYTFGNLLLWTLIWALFATFSNYILGMILAILINKKGIRLKKLWRGIFVMTIAVPQFVSLLLMSQMLSDEGVVNQLLQNWGLISEPIRFLTSTKGITVKATIILVNIWVGIPYTMLITTGILMNIPSDLYESASLDGAGPVRVFFSITIPYMLFVTTPYLITQFIGNINNFNVIYLLTGGGPLNADFFQAGHSDLLITWLFKLTVDDKNYAVASTIGIFVFIVSALFALITYNLSGSVKREEEFQ